MLPRYSHPPIEDNYSSVGRGAGRPDAGRASAEIGAVFEVVGRVLRPLEALPAAVKGLLARVQAREALLERVLLVQMLRQAKAVAEGTIDRAARVAVSSLEKVTVQVVSFGHRS